MYVNIGIFGGVSLNWMCKAEENRGLDVVGKVSAAVC